MILEAQRRLVWSDDSVEAISIGRTPKESSDDSVEAISRALGFSEASNFTKYFRARTGESPTAFRRSGEPAWTTRARPRR